MGRACSDPSAGADINGVGVIGHSDRVPLSDDVLFDVDRHELKPAARDALATLADQWRMMLLARIVVEGHTDNTFTDAHNRRLSNRRARVVADFLQERIPNVQILRIG